MTASQSRRGGNASQPNVPAALTQVPDGVTPELTALRTVMDSIVRERTEKPNVETKTGTDTKNTVENLTRVVTVSLKAIELAWTYRETTAPDAISDLECAIDALTLTNLEQLVATPAAQTEPERTIPC